MYLEVKELKKVYGKGNSQTQALKSVNFGVNKGEFVAIMGESGSGKSTLLNIMATLDTPTSGEVTLDGIRIDSLKESELAAFRREKLGFVFQDFNLLNTLSNKDNIFLPLVLSDKDSAFMDKRLDGIKDLIGIEKILERYPYEVSGGQKQRVAIARALITEPSIILADEPTGMLDSNTSRNIMELFSTISQKGHTLLMVTHSVRDAAYAERVLFIKDGIVYHELYKAGDSNNVFQEKISDTLAFFDQGGQL